SLVGSTANDGVGGGAIVVLTNGNIVTATPTWDNAGVVDAGAVTWLNGNGTTVGAVTALNSVVGSSTNDQVGRISSITASALLFHRLFNFPIDLSLLPIIAL